MRLNFHGDFYFCEIVEMLAPRKFRSFNFHEYVACLVLRLATDEF